MILYTDYKVRITLHKSRLGACSVGTYILYKQNENLSHALVFKIEKPKNIIVLNKKVYFI